MPTMHQHPSIRMCTPSQYALRLSACCAVLLGWAVSPARLSCSLAELFFRAGAEAPVFAPLHHVPTTKVPSCGLSLPRVLKWHVLPGAYDGRKRGPEKMHLCSAPSRCQFEFRSKPREARHGHFGSWSSSRMHTALSVPRKTPLLRKRLASGGSFDARAAAGARSFQAVEEHVRDNPRAWRAWWPRGGWRSIWCWLHWWCRWSWWQIGPVLKKRTSELRGDEVAVRVPGDRSTLLASLGLPQIPPSVCHYDLCSWGFCTHN